MAKSTTRKASTKSAADLAAAARYMARRRAARVAGEPEPTVAMVYERDGGVCYLCGGHTSPLGAPHTDSNRPTMDHLVPISGGGKHVVANVALACFACNRRKSTSLLVEVADNLAVLGN